MSWTKTRSKIALTLKADPAADVTELRRQLKEQRLAEHIVKKVAEAPPLTPEQLDRLAGLLRGGGRLAG